MEKENLSTNKSKYGDIIHYKDRKIHRADGPAITNSDGSVEFWIHGTQYSEQEFNKIKQNN